MPLSALMSLPQDQQGLDVFAFEHAMSHRDILNGIADISHFSAVPYFIEPMTDFADPAGTWAQNHQQAHDDMLAGLPESYGSDTVGNKAGNLLIDADLTDPAQSQWWTFTNFLEHQEATATISPPYPLTYPRW